MKFKELLQKVSFDDIVPHISRLDKNPWDREKYLIPYYKETYDILQHMQAEETDKQIRFYMDYDNAHYGEEPRVEMYLYEDDFESDYWPTNLGKEIVLGEDVELSDEEIAALCLFHITMYGFSPEETKKREPEPLNSYEEQALALREKQWVNYTRIKREENDLVYRPEVWKMKDMRMSHRNRMKRMRDHRQDMRIEQLKRMGQAERAIERILSTTRTLSREQLAYLFNTQLIQRDVFQSRTYDHTRRMDYLWEILTKYTAPDDRPYTHTVIVLSTAPNYPLTATEQQMFERIIAQFAEKTEVRSAVGVKADLDDEAELFIIKSY
ncbi:MAG: hypothetical protein K2I32_02980 [Alistipes sp.]|nr:hypothetical protein [Alistipes sp.]